MVGDYVIPHVTEAPYTSILHSYFPLILLCQQGVGKIAKLEVLMQALASTVTKIKNAVKVMYYHSFPHTVDLSLLRSYYCTIHPCRSLSLLPSFAPSLLHSTSLIPSFTRLNSPSLLPTFAPSHRRSFPPSILPSVPPSLLHSPSFSFPPSLSILHSPSLYYPSMQISPISGC